MSLNSGIFSSNSEEWATPQWLFEQYNKQFHFKTDVCANQINAKCIKFYSKEEDGLKMNWQGSCWCNPPYGRHIGLWLEKAYKSSVFGATVVCLVPSRTDTKWWVNWATKGKIEFIKGRLKFNGIGSAPFPSAIIIYPAQKSCWGIFEDLDIITKINIWGRDRIEVMAPWLLPEVEKYTKIITQYNLNNIIKEKSDQKMYKIRN